MNYKDYFTPWADKINSYLQKFFKEKELEAEIGTSVSVDLWKNLESFIVGGKRLRGGLVKLGYEIGGGKDFNEILKISAAIEILHGAILVHDDIIDQDEVRHSRPTVHKIYEKYHSANYNRGKLTHYGMSMAMMVGDAGLFEANILVAESKFPDDHKIKALRYLNRYMLETVYGESLDIDLSYRKAITEDDVSLINYLKTAKYSIIGPLCLGLILSGKDENELNSARDFGHFGGLAYQLQDDILGIFGNTEKSGKSNMSDIKEGKNTLLYIQALEMAGDADKKRLKSLWGNRDITELEADEVRKIIKNSGSVEFSRSKAVSFINEAKKNIPNITKSRNYQEVLGTLADYIINRDK